MSKRKINNDEVLNKKFVRNCEEVFEQPYDDLAEEQYQGMVVTPFRERLLVEQFERSIEIGD